MNRNLIVLTALGAGLALAPFAVAQTAPAAAAAPVAPVAMDAKIALVNFEQVVLASNEGQVVTANTQKKFEPQKTEIEKLSTEVETMKKGLTPTMADDARAKLLRDIDLKEKALNSRAEEAQTAYNAEWQEGLAAVAQKIAGTMKKYAADSGFTLLLDVSSQQSNVLWAVPSTDISQAVVDLYNKQSGMPRRRHRLLRLDRQRRVRLRPPRGLLQRHRSLRPLSKRQGVSICERPAKRIDPLRRSCYG